MIEISLLGTFGVSVNGRPVETMSTGSKRLLALLALRDRSVSRSAIAGTLWPEASGARAGESLRSALSRLEVDRDEAILADSAGLSLGEAVKVDLHKAQAMAQRLLKRGGEPLDSDLTAAAIALLSLELLPDWYDDWVESDAEDWRQLRVNALEAQAQLLIDVGRLPEASGAARAAMRVEPLRESAHASLIRVHLAEGNQSEALRVFDRYSSILHNELGLEPTPRVLELVAGLRAS